MYMISDPYAAGYTFARSAFTGGPTRDQKAVRTIYIIIYNKMKKEVGMLLQKRTDTSAVGIYKLYEENTH